MSTDFAISCRDYDLGPRSPLGLVIALALLMHSRRCIQEELPRLVDKGLDDQEADRRCCCGLRGGSFYSASLPLSLHLTSLPTSPVDTTDTS